jgi:hypothetical protein
MCFDKFSIFDCGKKKLNVIFSTDLINSFRLLRNPKICLMDTIITIYVITLTSNSQLNVECKGP